MSLPEYLFYFLNSVDHLVNVYLYFKSKLKPSPSMAPPEGCAPLSYVCAIMTACPYHMLIRHLSVSFPD